MPSQRIGADRQDAAIEALDLAGQAVAVLQMDDIDLVGGPGARSAEEHQSHGDHPRQEIRNFGATLKGRRGQWLGGARFLRRAGKEGPRVPFRSA